MWLLPHHRVLLWCFIYHLCCSSNITNTKPNDSVEQWRYLDCYLLVVILDLSIIVVGSIKSIVIPRHIKLFNCTGKSAVRKFGGQFFSTKSQWLWFELNLESFLGFKKFINTDISWIMLFLALFKISPITLLLLALFVDWVLLPLL